MEEEVEVEFREDAEVDDELEVRRRPWGTWI